MKPASRCPGCLVELAVPEELRSPSHGLLLLGLPCRSPTNLTQALAGQCLDLLPVCLPRGSPGGAAVVHGNERIEATKQIRPVLRCQHLVVFDADTEVLEHPGCRGGVAFALDLGLDECPAGLPLQLGGEDGVLLPHLFEQVVGPDGPRPAHQERSGGQGEAQQRRERTSGRRHFTSLPVNGAATLHLVL